MLKKMTNIEIENCLNDLKPLLDKTGIVGYIAAVNTTRLENAFKEYLKVRDAAIDKYGYESTDDQGNPTKRIDKGTEGFNKFLEEIAPIAGFEHEIDLEMLSAREACNTLNGRQLLNIKWMLDFSNNDIVQPIPATNTPMEAVEI